MLKLFIWDLLDFLHRDSMVLIGMIASLVLILIPEKGTGTWNSLLITIAALLGFIVFQAVIVLAAIFPILSLSRESSLLERSLPFPTWKIVVSKLVFACVLNLVACLFIFQLILFFNWFSTGHLHFLSADNLKGLLAFLPVLVLIDMSLLFTYILGKSFRIFNRISSLVTALVVLVLIGGFTLLTVLMMTSTGALLVPSFSTNGLAMEGSFQVNSVTIPVVFSIVLILLEFFASNSLLKTRFQKE